MLQKLINLSNHTACKRVGVLGGMGIPEATINFEQSFHVMSRQFITQKFSTGYPPLITAYFREVPIRITNNGSVSYPLMPNRNLLYMAEQIGKLSDFLVITSNTPHFFINEIEKAAGKEVLSIVDVTLDNIKERKLKKIGIIAIGLTLKNKLYQARLALLGIECIELPEHMTNSLDAALFQVMQGSITKQSINEAKSAINTLRNKNADGIILGCTELPFLLEEMGIDNDLLNPLKLTALAAVKKSIGLKS